MPLLLHQLVTLTAHRLNIRAPVALTAQFLANAAHMHIDTSIETRQRPPQRFFRQFVFGDDTAEIHRQRFQQIKLGTGEIHILIEP